MDTRFSSIPLLSAVFFLCSFVLCRTSILTKIAPSKRKYFSFETKPEAVKMSAKGETMKQLLRNYRGNCCWEPSPIQQISTHSAGIELFGNSNCRDTAAVRAFSQWTVSCNKQHDCSLWM